MIYPIVKLYNRIPILVRKTEYQSQNHSKFTEQRREVTILIHTNKQNNNNRMYYFSHTNKASQTQGQTEEFKAFKSWKKSFFQRDKEELPRDLFIISTPQVAKLHTRIQASSPELTTCVPSAKPRP